MKSNNMDRLFRERADQYEIKPSAAAWDAIQGQVKTKSSPWPMIVKVAAAVVIMISSVIVVLNWTDDTETILAGTADHPTRTGQTVAWKLPEGMLNTDQPDIYAANSPQMTKEDQKEDAPLLGNPTTQRAYLELLSVVVAWELPVPQKPGIFMNEPLVTRVKIRYYASNATVETESEKEKKSFSQFIARAQEKLSPDELLADLRTAKDDLFKGNRGD